jgi:hypothetical protein
MAYLTHPPQSVWIIFFKPYVFSPQTCPFSAVEQRSERLSTPG